MPLTFGYSSREEKIWGTQFLTAFVMFSKVELFANLKPEWLVVAPFLTGDIKQMSHIGGSAGVWGWGGEERRGVMCCQGKLTVYLQEFYKHRL